MPNAYTYDGRVRFVWLDTDPADPTAPTMAEITAGTDLSEYLIPESWNPNASNQKADQSTALSSFNGESVGRYGYAPEAMFKTKLTDATKVAWTTLGERLVEGCIVVFEDVPEGDNIAAGMDCDVYPSCQTGQPERQQTAANTTRRFKVTWAVGEPPSLGATVAA